MRSVSYPLRDSRRRRFPALTLEVFAGDLHPGSEAASLLRWPCPRNGSPTHTACWCRPPRGLGFDQRPGGSRVPPGVCPPRAGGLCSAPLGSAAPARPAEASGLSSLRCGRVRSQLLGTRAGAHVLVSECACTRVGPVRGLGGAPVLCLWRDCRDERAWCLPSGALAGQGACFHACAMWPLWVPGLHLISLLGGSEAPLCLVPGSPESCPRAGVRPEARVGRGRVGEALLGGLPVSRRRCCCGPARADLVCGGCPPPAALPPAGLPADPPPRCTAPPYPVSLPVGFVMGFRDWTRREQQAQAARADLRGATRPCGGRRGTDVPTRLRCAPQTALAGRSLSAHQGQAGSHLLPGAGGL